MCWGSGSETPGSLGDVFARPRPFSAPADLTLAVADLLTLAGEQKRGRGAGHKSEMLKIY